MSPLGESSSDESANSTRMPGPADLGEPGRELRAAQRGECGRLAAALSGPSDAAAT